VYAKEYFHPFNPTPLQSKPIIIVGPSGVGKRTLVTSVLEKYGDLFERKKSVTTRKLRTGEEPDNCNFKFVSMEEFNKMVAEKKFIEYKEKLQGALYGTTFEEIERIKSAGRIPIIEVDVDGAIEINKMAIEGNFLFIYPPNVSELRKRIGNRIETEAEFKVRIADAIKQIELANNSVLFTNRIVNDKIEDATDQFFTLLEALYF
jgi:guanylate kinase